MKLCITRVHAYEISTPHADPLHSTTQRGEPNPRCACLEEHCAHWTPAQGCNLNYSSLAADEIVTLTHAIDRIHRELERAVHILGNLPAA